MSLFVTVYDKLGLLRKIKGPLSAVPVGGEWKMCNFHSLPFQSSRSHSNSHETTLAIPIPIPIGIPPRSFVRHSSAIITGTPVSRLVLCESSSLLREHSIQSGPEKNAQEKKHRLVVEVESLASSKKIRRVDVKTAASSSKKYKSRRT